VDAAAVCGTDGHLFPQDPPYPAILGHEVTGTIIDQGKKAHESLNLYGDHLQVGDRIALYPWITCGKCQGCLTYGSGTCTVCDDSFVYGIPYEKLGLNKAGRISSNVAIAPHFKGGFAEYMYVFPGTYVWKLPQDMPSEVAALLDPTGVAVRAIELAVTCPGVVEEAFTTRATVAVIGAGPVGILAALISKLMGVEQVIVIGGRKQRLTLAKELAKADEIIDIHEMDAQSRVDRVKHLTQGKGADVVLQCANTPAAFIEGLEMLRRMGTLVEVGNMVNTGTCVPFDPARHLCGKHARILGMSANNAKTFDKAFSILKRHQSIDFARLYSHTATLDTLAQTIRSINDRNYSKAVVRFN